MRILTNLLLDNIFFLISQCLQNLQKIKNNNYVINQIFKFQVFVVKKIMYKK